VELPSQKTQRGTKYEKSPAAPLERWGKESTVEGNTVDEPARRTGEIWKKGAVSGRSIRKGREPTKNEKGINWKP